ncbi:hypothetical protein [Thermogemmatispora sp.]|nr:hypothetical protein [Thermogemmatispora sp.]
MYLTDSVPASEGYPIPVTLKLQPDPQPEAQRRIAKLTETNPAGKD